MRSGFRFAVNVTSNWANRVCTILIGLFTVPYAIWKLGDEVYGIFGTISSVLASMNLLDLGLSASVSRFSSQEQADNDREALGETISTSQFAYLILGVIGALGLIAATPFLHRYFNIREAYIGDFSFLAACLAIAFCLGLSRAPARGILVGAGRFELINATEIIAALARLAVMVTLFECFTPNLRLFGLAVLTQYVIQWTGTHLMARYAGGKGLLRISRITRKAFRRIFGFGSLNWIASVSGLIIQTAPNLIIARMLGVEQVTRFAPSNYVATNLRSLIMGFTSPLVPIAAKLKSQDSRVLADVSIRVTRLACIMVILILLPLFVFAKPLLRLWVGDKFGDTSLLLVVASIGSASSSIQMVNYFITVGAGNIKPWAFSQLIAAITAVPGAFIVHSLWPETGLLGIVSAFSVALIVRSSVYIPYRTCRDYGISWTHYMRQSYLRPLLPAIPPILVCAFFSNDDIGIVSLASFVTLTIIMYGAGCWYVAIDDRDKTLIQDLVGKILSKVRRT